MAAAEQITFPAGVLGLEPVRVPIIGRGDGWFALSKPAGIAVGGDSLDAQARDLSAALSAALVAGKKQLAELGIAHAGRVHYLDAAATGALILALSSETEAKFRNAVGSCRWEFVFDFLAQTSNHAEGETITCDLPLMRHSVEPRVVVSHASGKKCQTQFRPVRPLGRWTLWEARTRDNRPHQVRVHAAERDLRIPGETTYGKVPRVFLSDLKPKYRPGSGEERPLHPALCLHLREIEMKSEMGVAVRVVAPWPKTFQVLLRRLEDAANIGPRQLRL